MGTEYSYQTSRRLPQLLFLDKEHPVKITMAYLTNWIWLPRVLVTCAVMATLFIAVPHAHAGTSHKTLCGVVLRGSESVGICVWMDTGNGHIRGEGSMSASNSHIHVQIDKINLGTANGVVATTSGPKNSSTGYIPEYYTKSINEGCGPYHARLYYSIRWSDGTLLSNQQTPLTDWYSKC